MGLYLGCSVFSMTHIFFNIFILSILQVLLEMQSVNPQSVSRWSFDDLFTLLSYRLREFNWCAPRSWQIIQQRLSAHQWDTQKPPILWSLAGETVKPPTLTVFQLTFLLQKDQNVVATFKTWGLWAYKMIFDLFCMDGPWLVPMCSILQVFMSSCHYCQETTFTTTSTTGTTTSTTSTSNSTTSSTMTTITAAMQQLAIWGHEVVLRRRYRDTKFTQVGHGSE